MLFVCDVCMCSVMWCVWCMCPVFVGVCMIHVWFVKGVCLILCVVYACFLVKNMCSVYGICVWGKCGVSMGYAWCVIYVCCVFYRYVLCVVHVWRVCACVWGMCCICVVCI